MKFWLVAAVATAVTVPGAPPLKPHLHYEVRVNRIDKPLTVYERLLRTCDLTRTVEWYFRGSRDEVLRLDLKMLRKSACDLPRANSN